MLSHRICYLAWNVFCRLSINVAKKATELLKQPVAAEVK